MHSKQRRDRYTRARPRALTVSQDVPSAAPARLPEPVATREPAAPSSPRSRRALEGTAGDRGGRKVGGVCSLSCGRVLAAEGLGEGREPEQWGPEGCGARERPPAAAAWARARAPLPPLGAPWAPELPREARRLRPVRSASKAPCCCASRGGHAPRPGDLSWGPALLSAPNTDSAAPLEKTSVTGSPRRGQSARPVSPTEIPVWGPNRSRQPWGPRGAGLCYQVRPRRPARPSSPLRARRPAPPADPPDAGGGGLCTRPWGCAPV